MTKEEYYLTLLMEECSEVIQRCSKSIRFGNNKTKEGSTKSNKEKLSEEVMDVFTIVSLLEEMQVVDFSNYNKFVVNKVRKINKYTPNPEFKINIYE